MEFGDVLDLAFVLAVLVGFFALFLWRFGALPKWLFVVIAGLGTAVVACVLYVYVSLDLACARGNCL